MTIFFLTSRTIKLHLCTRPAPTKRLTLWLNKSWTYKAAYKEGITSSHISLHANLSNTDKIPENKTPTGLKCHHLDI